MAFMAVLESDLRALSAEARRRYPAVKDAAEHAILKLRSLSSPNEIAHNEDILRIFLMACDVKTVKLSVIGLSCLQKLIAHDAVAHSAVKYIILTLKEHAEMTDESVQLKTLQTILIVFQSHLHPLEEDNMAQALGICLRLLESSRSSDSVRNTAAATFRQAVALVFGSVASVESLPPGKFGSNTHVSRTSTITEEISRSFSSSVSISNDFVSGGPTRREVLTKVGKLGLRLLEDLTALAAGGSASWLRVVSLQRAFALDILEYNGMEGAHIKVTDFVRDPDCIVCGPGTLIELDTSTTLSQFIEQLGEHPNILLSKASVTHRGKNLYMQSPPILEEMTRSNLQLPLFDLMGKVAKDIIHVSGTSEKNDKKTSGLRKLRVIFKGLSDGITNMDTTDSL